MTASGPPSLPRARAASNRTLSESSRSEGRMLGDDGPVPDLAQDLQGAAAAPGGAADLGQRLRGRHLDVREPLFDQLLEQGHDPVVLEPAEGLDGPQLQLGMFPVAGVLLQGFDIRGVVGQGRQQMPGHDRPEAQESRDRRLPDREVAAPEVADQGGHGLRIADPSQAPQERPLGVLVALPRQGVEQRDRGRLAEAREGAHGLFLDLLDVVLDEKDQGLDADLVADLAQGLRGAGPDRGLAVREKLEKVGRRSRRISSAPVSGPRWTGYSERGSEGPRGAIRGRAFPSPGTRPWPG